MRNRYDRLKEWLTSLKPNTANLILLAGFTVAMTFIVGYLALDPNAHLDLSEGDVAPVDIRAPADASFESAILTEAERQQTVNNISSVFITDNEVTRRQVLRARAVLDYIEYVRHDAYATRSQQYRDLLAISDLELDSEQVSLLLRFSDANWQRFREQVSDGLSSIMSDEVREENLEDIYDTIPRRIVPYSTEQDRLVIDVISQLIQPNTFIDPEATEAARQTARESVGSVVRSFREDQAIVQRGRVITALDWEALDQLGLLDQSNDPGPRLASAFIIVVLSELVTGLYICRFHGRLFRDRSTLVALGLLFIGFLALARLMFAFDPSWLAYFYPGAALALLVAGLTGPELGILAAMVLGFLIGSITNDAEIVSLVAIGGIMGVLYLRHAERVNVFFRAGILAGAAGAGAAFAFGLVAPRPDLWDLLARAGAAWVNGVLSAALALAGLYVLGSVFNVTTGLLLTDLARSDQLLLQRLMLEAPGTYQHSLMVANLAEAAAEAIEANTLLVKVGSLYHDIGKMYNPLFFVENQAYGHHNIHEELSPLESAQAIIQHVIEGDKLARKHHLPSAVRDFILEHHGTTMPAVFWHNAVEAAGGDERALNKAEFTYPGPKPQSRETALVMVADSCESAMRATRPSSKEAIAGLVSKIISNKMSAGQFDECNLTLRDLDTIRDTIIGSLKGVFHQRVTYPDGKKRAAAEAAPKAPAPANKAKPPGEVGQPAGVKATAKAKPAPDAKGGAAPDAPGAPKPSEAQASSAGPA